MWNVFSSEHLFINFYSLTCNISLLRLMRFIILQWGEKISLHHSLITKTGTVPVTRSCFISRHTTRHKVKRLMLADSSWTGARLLAATSGDLDLPGVDVNGLRQEPIPTTCLMISSFEIQILPVIHKNESLRHYSKFFFFSNSKYFIK